MPYKKQLAQPLILIVMLFLVALLVAPVLVSAQIVPTCNSADAPGQPGACGLAKLAELGTRLIKWLTIIAIPIAALMIGWGGFDLLTAAGRPGRVGAGHDKITIAVSGLVILLLSWLIINAIFIGLGVEPGFNPLEGGTI